MKHFTEFFTPPEQILLERCKEYVATPGRVSDTNWKKINKKENNITINCGVSVAKE